MGRVVDHEATQGEILKQMEKRVPLYVGAARDSMGRFDELGHKFGGDIEAYFALSFDMKTDEEALLKLAFGRSGNENEKQTSDMAPGRGGYVIAIFRL